jgi:hypothetical protein
MLKHIKINFNPRHQLSIAHILRDMPKKVTVNVFFAHQPDPLPSFFLKIGQSYLNSKELLVGITHDKCFLLPRSLEATRFDVMICSQFD